MQRRSMTLVVAVLLLAAACGGSDEPIAPDADTADTATPVVEDTPPPDNSDGVAADGPGDDEGGDTDDLAGFFSSETCFDLAMAFSQAGSMGMAGTTGGPEDSARALQRMAEVAPAEIADELEILADAFGDFARVLSEAGVDLQDATSLADPQIQEALTEAVEAFDSEVIEEAGTRVSDYLDAECDGG